MSEIVDAEYREAGNALAVREEPTAGSLTLFGTDDPDLIVEKAARISTALFKVVEDRKLYKDIQGKKYLFVEAWQFMGMMLGVTTFAEWSRPVDGGWEARAVVRTARGIDIGAAEAQCLRSESRWRTADDYAVRSMALTRATSKALRSVLAFIAVLAGYAPTPADEVPDKGFDATPPTSKPDPAPKADNAAKLVDLRRRWAATWPDVTEANEEDAFRAEFAGKTVRDIAWAVEAREREIALNKDDVAAGAIRRPASPKSPPPTTAQAGTEPAAGADSGGDTSAAAASADEVTRARTKKAGANLTCPEGAAQHGFLFALHNELGHSDDDRADLYERIGGVRSHAKLSPANFRKVVDHMNAEISRRDNR